MLNPKPDSPPRGKARNRDTAAMLIFLHVRRRGEDGGMTLIGLQSTVLPQRSAAMNASHV